MSLEHVIGLLVSPFAIGVSSDFPPLSPSFHIILRSDPLKHSISFLSRRRSKKIKIEAIFQFITLP